MSKHESDDAPYASMDFSEAVGIVRDSMGIKPSLFVGESTSTSHYQHPLHERERPLNLVIILEESLGAEFVGALGGLKLTPYLDQLIESGIAFDHLYATGTRSVRGIEALVNRLPPFTSQECCQATALTTWILHASSTAKQGRLSHSLFLWWRVALRQHGAILHR